MKITIVDYGMGNLWSVKNALEFIGSTAIISSDPELVSHADCLILPGVGAFGPAIQNIQSGGLQQAMEYAVLQRGVPFLGICLGMQLLAGESEESGKVGGLGWIPGRVTKFKDGDVRLPHMGFNATVPSRQHSLLFRDIGMCADFYFVHSYHFSPNDEQDILSTTEYGIKFVSAVQKENIVGVQFHPEKSQSNGLQFLSNFIKFGLAC